MSGQRRADGVRVSSCFHSPLCLLSRFCCPRCTRARLCNTGSAGVHAVRHEPKPATTCFMGLAYIVGCFSCKNIIHFNVNLQRRNLRAGSEPTSSGNLVTWSGLKLAKFRTAAAGSVIGILIWLLIWSFWLSFVCRSAGFSSDDAVSFSWRWTQMH